MSNTPRIGAPELVSGQAIPETTVNEQVRYLEQGANRFILKDKELATPPGSPADGDGYIVAGSPTGAWTGHAKHIAFRMGTGWLFIVPIEGTKAYLQDEDAEYQYDGSNWVVATAAGALLAANNLSDVANAATAGANIRPVESLVIAASDETTALTTGAAKVTFRIPYAFTLTAVRASLATAQSSGSILTVDVNEGGSSILSTKLTIDNGEKTSTTAAAAPVMSDTSLADDAEITIDIDQVGDGTAKGLKVTLIGHRT